MYVMYLSNFDSLRRTQTPTTSAAVRGRLRLAQARAGALGGGSRDPRRRAVETRVVADVTLDVPEIDEPASGRLVSIPADGGRAQRRVPARGRWIEPARPDEVLASEAFVKRTASCPGDRVSAIINGRRRELTIVGVALSPEYVYSIRPGELIPDDRRFGIFWMERGRWRARSTWRAASTTWRSALPAAPPRGGDRRLDACSSRTAGSARSRARCRCRTGPRERAGAAPELRLHAAADLPAVAAFILNVAITRALSLQRPQIAALKALGYGNASSGGTT
jgi:putative ABC transport system permease protein